jgi:predicted 3-demethylubiquinone-9 3-methyltransferase (glyoxalase superfamily)
MNRVTPYLWFDNQAEEAANFYVAIFRNSRVESISRYPENPHAPAGSVMTATVSLDGQQLILLNGGPVFKPTEAFSLLVRCADQAEVDYYWERLLAEGSQESMCGWLKDRFGVSWQVIPDELMQLLGDPDPKRAARATAAMLKMRKIDLATLRAAAQAE